MMKKIKSRGTAKIKYLLIFPLVLFLILVFAEPKIVIAGDNVKPDKTEQKLAQKEMTEKFKTELNRLKMQEEVLHKKLQQAKTNEDKKKFKEKIRLHQLKRKSIEAKLKGESDYHYNDNYNRSLIELKQKYAELQEIDKRLRKKLESAKDPEDRKKLQMKLDDVKKQQTLLKHKANSIQSAAKPNFQEQKDRLKLLQETVKKVEQKLLAEKDPGKQKELKQYLTKLLQKRDQLKKTLKGS